MQRTRMTSAEAQIAEYISLSLSQDNEALTPERADNAGASIVRAIRQGRFWNAERALYRAFRYHQKGQGA